MPYPKPQLMDAETPNVQRKQKYKLQEIQVLRYSTAKRTDDRRTHRQLRKCHHDLASQDETYSGAQERRSHKVQLNNKSQHQRYGSAPENAEQAPHAPPV